MDLRGADLGRFGREPPVVLLFGNDHTINGPCLQIIQFNMHLVKWLNITDSGSTIHEPV